MKAQVICIPGSVAPAAQRYKPLIDGAADAADFYLKDLEVYREAKPPAGSERIISLGLFEPAQIPGQLSAEEQAFFTVLRHKLDGLQGDDFMRTFIREQVKPGAVLAPPPPGPVSPEMQKRPAGIAALIAAFQAFPFDRDLLRAAPFPVFYGYGDLSHSEQALKAGILARLFPDIHVQRYAGVHHFVPADQIYTAPHVSALGELWQRAERLASQLSY